MSTAEPLFPVRTTCPYCGIGCGVIASSRDARTEVRGDPTHPANLGRLCSKGSALGETVQPEGRLLHPAIRDAQGILRDVSWERALERVADGFSRIIREHGPDAVAFYVSGQLLTEDYYVANKLMKGFIGSANIDTNSRLCMSSAVAGHVRAFGEDVVPCSYEDVEQADLLVLVGSNTAWCHPVLYQRVVAERQRRPDLKIVVVDPRRTDTCDIADLHLPLHAGTDVALFNGLLRYLQAAGAVDQRFIENSTEGLEDALAAASPEGVLDAVARTCGVARATLTAFYDLFAQTTRVVTLFSQGVNQSSSGTDKVNSIINCHLYTGRIGIPGAGPFSITGQPNAMGGREVGGLANMLAAHLQFGNDDHHALLSEFWRTPRLAREPGLKAVDLFNAVGRGEVKAVWVMATNPVVSLPDANAVREALRGCELLVVSDNVADTDTTALAHVCLPATAWGEKDGTVTNSERVISRQRGFLRAPGQARADWWAICEVARRMGFAEHFDYSSAHEIFIEHARLSTYRNPQRGSGRRMFRLDALEKLDRRAYDHLAPTRWPTADVTSPFAAGQFPTPSGRARFVATVARPPKHAPSEAFPFVLNTGRVRDQWHTMTRSGRSPRLAGHRPEPYVDVHPSDALTACVRNGELARVGTAWGSIVVRVRCTDEQRRGTLFVPIHWSSPVAADARVGGIVNPVVDPVSGEPEFKHTPSTLEPFPVDWYGFALSRDPVQLEGTAYWTRVTGTAHTRTEFAGRGSPHGGFSQWSRDQLGADDQWLEYSDSTDGIYRAARLAQGQLQACVFISPRIDLPDRDWLGSLFAKDRLDDAERFALLAGRRSQHADAGPVVCACFGVGRTTLVRAIGEHRLDSPEAIGLRLQAGTNCGSCVPELRRLIAGVKEGLENGTVIAA